MHYLIARDGQQLGQFSEEEVRSGLFEGRYKTTDVAWTEGMPDWKPLGEIMGQGVTRIAGPTGGATPSSGMGGLGGVPTLTPGIAVTALVLGILAMLSCGVLGLTAIPAIVCGHLALSKIRKSDGALGGRGMATTGLVMGYVSLPIGIIVAIVGSLSMASVDAISKMAEKGEVIKGINDVRHLSMACKLYALDNEGKYPPTVQDLVTESNIEQDAVDKAEAFKPETWLGEPGFDYLGAGLTEEGSGSTQVFVSRCYSKDGKRVVATLDGAVELKKMPTP